MARRISYTDEMVWAGNHFVITIDLKTAPQTRFVDCVTWINKNLEGEFAARYSFGYRSKSSAIIFTKDRFLALGVRMRFNTRVDHAPA